jgi:hypothetical protein
VIETDAWPPTLRDEINRRCGHFTVRRCGGFSRAHVWKVVSDKLSLVVKQQSPPHEVRFYESVAPHLRQIGVGIPEVEFIVEDAGQFWLVLECLPQTLPKSQWLADPEILRMLSLLHSVQDLGPTEWEVGYCPMWPQARTLTALQYFPSDMCSNMGLILEELRNRADFLFTSECWISGDPNPTNWGLRHDQTLALFDWQRFGRGTPALDLAITIPGFGNLPQYRMVAEGYLAARGKHCPLTRTADGLAIQIGLAKAWSVIEFLALDAKGSVDISGNHAIKAIRGHFPGWLFETGVALSKSQ